MVEKVVRDPDRDSFIDVMVKPAAHLDRLDEVMVITSTEPRFSPAQQDMATSEALKGADAAAHQGTDEGIADHGRAAAGADRSKPAPDQQPLHDMRPNPRRIRRSRCIPTGSARRRSILPHPRRAADSAAQKPASPSQATSSRGRARRNPAQAREASQPSRGGTRSHGLPRRELSPRSGDSPLSAAGLRTGSVGFAGAAGLVAAGAGAACAGSICRWW